MKAKFIFLAFLFLLLHGCAKEENAMIRGTSDPSGTGVMPVVKRVGFSGTFDNGQLIPINEMENYFGNQLKPRTSPNSSVNVHCNPIPGFTANFAGMENNSGIHGNGHIWNSDFISFKFEAECMIFDGNEAVYGAEVTELIYVTQAWIDYAGDVIQPGAHILLKVIDNGEGENASPDQICEFFIVDVFPFPSGPLCSYFPPDHPVWSPGQWGHMIDLDNSTGNPVQVK